ncbi:uncharacterized protein LOC119662598 isoform X2 [Teleopsis dalmanni]|uniref:uncharacterized protein LOC119662598 isoform X2 n=1 Tax=Teleopsis dalmanni TaxID=139649 RepID=UPI0018CD8C46|nr:uncharacterized protein LOC119662598 isoform X2 [Teleopsis dalmanni]
MDHIEDASANTVDFEIRACTSTILPISSKKHILNEAEEGKYTNSGLPPSSCTSIANEESNHAISETDSIQDVQNVAEQEQFNVCSKKQLTNEISVSVITDTEQQQQLILPQQKKSTSNEPQYEEATNETDGKIIRFSIDELTNETSVSVITDTVITGTEQQNLSQQKKSTLDKPQWEEATRDVSISKTDGEIIKFSIDERKQTKLDVSVITDTEQENLSQQKKSTSDEPQFEETTNEVSISKTDGEIIRFSIDELTNETSVSVITDTVITDTEQENLSQQKKSTSNQPQWEKVTKEVSISKNDGEIIKFSIDELKQIREDIESKVTRNNLNWEPFDLTTKNNNDKVISNSISNKLKEVFPYHSDTSLEYQYSTVNTLSEVRRTNLNITKSSSFPYIPNSVSQGHMNFLNENTIASERPTKKPAKYQKHITIRYDDSDEEDKKRVPFCPYCL